MPPSRLLASIAAPIVLVGVAACSVTPADERPVSLADPFHDLVFGAVADFPDGQITEVESPRAVLVTWIDDELIVFHRKDPNNGCRLQLAADVVPAAGTEIPVEAVYRDPCHGSVYDAAGVAIDDADATPMYRLDVVVRDGQVVWPR